MSISIISFTMGTTIHSSEANANFNAVTGALSGAVANNFLFVATSNASIALSTQLPTAPSSDQDVALAQVSLDTVGRIALYVRSADNMGGLRAGSGGSYVTNLYPFAFTGSSETGWITPQPFMVQRTLSSANKLVHLFHITDGKDIGIIINNATKSPYFYNYTDTKFGVEINMNDSSMYVSTGTSTPGNYFAQLDSAGGGNPGKKVWVGTTDPGGAATEGDIWIKA